MQTRKGESHVELLAPLELPNSPDNARADKIEHGNNVSVFEQGNFETVHPLHTERALTSG